MSTTALKPFGLRSARPRREVAGGAGDQHVDRPGGRGEGRERCRDRRRVAHVEPVAERWPAARRGRRRAASIFSCRRLPTPTRAPAAAKARAMPRLMPLVPPATKTAQPV